MTWKFWKKPKPNSVHAAANQAMSAIDRKLPANATEEDFAKVLTILASNWCITNMEGEKLDRKEALRRAGVLYQWINESIYQNSEEPDSLRIFGVDR